MPCFFLASNSPHRGEWFVSIVGILGSDLKPIEQRF